MRISNKVLRVISCVLVLCLVITGMQLPAYAGTSAGITTSGFALKIGGEVIDESTTEFPEVSNGDEISIQLNWRLDNTDRTRRNFTIDFNDMITNLEIIDALTPQKITKDSEIIGEYYIEDGILNIEFYDDTEFIDGDERYGGLNIGGKISVDDSVSPTDTEIEIEIGNLKKTVPYVNDAQAVFYKDCVGNAQIIDDGNGNTVVRQTFKLDLHGNNGDFIVNDVQDIMGDKLSNMSKLVVTTNTAANATGLVVGESYTWAEFEAAIENKVIKEGEKIYLEYTTDVDPGVYGSDFTYAPYTNTVKVYYNDKADPYVDGDTSVWVNRPSVGKNGVLDEKLGEKGVTWTIRVNLGDFKDVAWDTIMQQITDTPGVGFEGEGVPVNLDKALFTMTSEGVYEYTYFLPFTDEYADSTSKLTAKNSVDITLDHPEFGEYTYTGNGSVQTKGEGWINKEFVSYDSATKTINWKITLDDVPAGIENVAIDEYTNDYSSGLHILSNTDISIEYDAVQKQIVSNGVFNTSENKYDADTDILTMYELSGWSNGSSRIVFNNDFISEMAGKDIIINVTSEITDADLSKTFINCARITYTDNGVGQDYLATASFRNSNQCLSKKGVAVSDANAIDYKVYVDLTRFDIEVGKVFEIADTLPAGMKLDTSIGDNGIKSLFGNKDEGWNIFIPDLSELTTVTVEEDAAGDKVTIAITVSSQLYDKWLEKKDDYTKLAIELDYRAYVEDQSTFTKNGVEVEFTNNVTGTYDSNTIGLASSTVALTPQDILAKNIDTGLMDQNIVKYEVEINPNKIDLAAGDTVKGVDTLGRGLEYILSDNIYPMVIESENPDGSWTTLTGGSDYTYEYITESNSLVFVMPDATSMKLTYYAKCNIRKEEYYQENVATNQFTLSGYQNNGGSSSSVLPKASLELAGWGDYQIGDITLYKFWNNGQMIALPDSEFALYKTTLNGNVLELGTLVQDDIVVGQQGTVVISNLNVDTIYALVETKAPVGYARNTEPYYFILPGSNMIALPSGYDIQYFVDNSTLNYENKTSETGDLVLKKTATGIDDWATIADSISFVIEQDGYEVMTVNGTDLDPVSHSKTIKLNVGKYKITESVTLPTGYVCETTYVVDNGASNNGKVATDVMVVANGDTALTFNNAYTQEIPEKGQLTVTKTVTGDLTWDDVKANVKFEILNGNTVVETILGSNLDATTLSKTVELEPGTYTVREVVTDVTGYTRTTTYSVNAGAVGEGLSVPAEVTSSQVTEVTFTNDYEVIKGELTVTKTVTGDLTWNDVKANVEFEILKGNTVVETILGSDLDAATLSKTVELEPGTYTVREVVTDVTGYTRTTTYSVNAGAIGEGLSVTAEVTSSQVTEVTFTNDYEVIKGELTVTKTVTGDLTWDDVKANVKFEILNGNTVVETILGSDLDAATLSKTVELEPGTYTVREVVTDVTGYTRTTTYSVNAGAVGEGLSVPAEVTSSQVTEVTFTNDYEVIKGELTVKKNITGDLTWNDVKANVKFEILNGNTVVETILGNDLDAATLSKSVELEPGTYTVREVVTDVTGYTRTTTYSVNAGASGEGLSVPAEVTSSQVTEVTFTNDYEVIPPEKGSVKVTKTVTGDLTWDDVKANVKFEILDGNTVVETILGNQLDAMLSKTVELDPGTYTVREVVTDVTGYTRTTTYSVNAGASGEGLSVPAEVTSSQVTEVTFTNDYEVIKGELTVKKTVTGDLTLNDVKANVKFEILSGTTIIATILGSQLDGNGSSVVEIEPGTYTVREVVTDISGYECVTTYSVDLGAATEGTSTQVEVESNSEKTVTFNNNYTANAPDTGMITVEKLVTGDLAWDAVKNNIKFEISQNGNVIRTINGSDLDPTTKSASVILEAGSYKVLEIVTVNDGYSCVTSYKVDYGTATEGKVADVTVVANASVVVTFTNEYAEDVTQEPTTEEPTTEEPTTEEPTTEEPTTEEPTTEEPTTEEPTTEEPTTEEPTTEEPTTEEPTTEEPTTEEPTPEEPTTEEPTTEEPTTEEPTTEEPTTEEPTTEAPTTEAPTTEAPTTEAPTTEAPTTEAPTTEAPTTEAPTTEAPTTEAPADEPEEDNPTEDDPTEPAPGSVDNPNTGDKGIGIYLISMFISCMIVLLAYASRKKETE